MGNYIKITVLIVLCLLVSAIYTLNKKNQQLQESLDISISNEKAFIAENNSLKEEGRVFKFTIEQLSYYNDSILNKIIALKEELQIKDKELVQAQYLLSKANKSDTIVFRDTIFRTETLDIDTLLKDEWHSINIHLKYPNTIITTPSFISEKFIVTNYNKETVNPPSKYWIVRLFQKKHKVLKVTVVEKNPYIQTEKQKFIEIIK